MNRHCSFSSVVLILCTSAFLSCSKSGQKVGTPPILILGSEKNFGIYTGEILKTEGYNLFTIDSVDADLQAEYLSNFDIVILAETSLTDDQQKELTRYVEEGGNLIAFRPDRTLNKLLGITSAPEKINDGYLKVSSRSKIGKGLLSQTLQFHDTADLNLLNGAENIVSLLQTKADTVESSATAVSFHSYGKGRAVAFSYNLPKSILLTRQGNFKDASDEKDGITGIRAMDLFTSGFVDTTKNTLNQADEHMRLLSHIISFLSDRATPLPRLWYFPDSLNCLVTLNNDGEDSKEVEFTPQFEDMAAKGASMTLYIKEVEFISKEWVDRWAKRGFEMSGHPDDTRQAANPDWYTMDSVYTALQKELKDSYGIDHMNTVTNHWFVWVGKNADGVRDFTAQAKIEEHHGVRLDCNYAHYDNGSSQGHFLGAMGTDQGNYTGSGLTMKFADMNGKIVQVYQQLNNVYDQQYMEHKDQEGYFQAFKGLMDRSLSREVYSSISVRAHNNEYFFSKVPLGRMLDYAKQNGVPVWSEQRWLEFIEAKDETSFTELKWSGGQLFFTINSSRKTDDRITCLIPNLHNKKPLKEVIIDGTPIAYSKKIVKSHEYAIVSVIPGKNYAVTANYEQ